MEVSHWPYNRGGVPLVSFGVSREVELFTFVEHLLSVLFGGQHGEHPSSRRGASPGLDLG